MYNRVDTASLARAAKAARTRAESRRGAFFFFTYRFTEEADFDSFFRTGDAVHPAFGTGSGSSYVCREVITERVSRFPATRSSPVQARGSSNSVQNPA